MTEFGHNGHCGVSVIQRAAKEANQEIEVAPNHKMVVETVRETKVRFNNADFKMNVQVILIQAIHEPGKQSSGQVGVKENC